MDFLIYLSYFILGYWVSKEVFSFRMRMLIKRIAKENNIDLDKEEKPQVVKVPLLLTELVDNSILIYDAKSNFMCQGKTLDEAAENLLKYKNVKLAAIIHKNNKFICIEGKVEKAQ